MQIVDREITAAPKDMDVRAWRARVLLWSGRLSEARSEYLLILAVVPNDPDNWVGLASTYSREGKTEEAMQALDHALALDPKRVDIHIARGRALRGENRIRESKLEFQKALELAPLNEEAWQGLSSLRSEPKHELRIGSETDLFSFMDESQNEELSLTSQWTPRWRSHMGVGAYRIAGIDAEKVLASLTIKSLKLGAVTVGAAVANDHGIIPKYEALAEYDKGWKLPSASVRGLEFTFGQHWYEYSTAKILTIHGTTTFYFPQGWNWSLGATGARSDFVGMDTEWRPSGLSRVGFPIVGGSEGRLAGNVFFATGTENFAQANQIGRFSSQTYGGGLRLQLTPHQDLNGMAAFQKRTGDRSEIGFGMNYAVRF